MFIFDVIFLCNLEAPYINCLADEKVNYLRKVYLKLIIDVAQLIFLLSSRSIVVTLLGLSFKSSIS